MNMNKDERIIQDLEIAISRLAANLLRIIAGAGKVQELDKQLQEAHTLANEVAQRGWSYADNAMQDALQIRFPFLAKASSGCDRDFNSEQHALHNIVDDALRLAAAKLLEDNSNASKNQTELRLDIKRYSEDIIELRRTRTRGKAGA